ncbi:MAG: ABC transporter ATP-binding protein [Candidatus Heimdallarchaeota archaeon]|nr:MAG: ABC transporter ATP-binding protein [Candidatus Heimdallarchaeota archaeon]
MIELNEVSKSFGDVVAVSRLTMTAKTGVTGFLGPNGAGKSTTLKLIMGEIRPDTGTVRVFDENPINNIILKRRIGYVSEHEDLYPWMKGKQFVSSLAKLILPREQAETAAKEALAKVGLAVKGKRIKSYSKGMKQRLKVAAAIVHDPDLLILDEPFGGLDPLGRREMKQLVSELNQEGVTVLISSHILYELDEMSTRMVLIHRGQALAEGPPEEVLNLIDQFPHQILFRAPRNELQTLSKLLIEKDIIRTITFPSDKATEDLIVVTDTPSTFYPTATRLIAENGLLINHLESQTDNIEAIFDFLT